MEWKIRETTFEADALNLELAVSPWSGHRLFGYDLTANIRPGRIVELGTHYGCSLFTFLQACKDEQIPGEIIAIDCWKGDEQAGFYGEEVLDTVKRTVREKFPQQNVRLIRKYFADALADVEEESADIIHIDGLHTYEAVREDFESWISRLKKDGIVLFHDVNSECGYGTDVFWQELEAQYECHYMFRHSWGLGVLFPKGDKYFRELKKENFDDKILIYENRAKLLLSEIQLNDHRKMVQERDALIEKMEGLISDRDQAIASMEAMIKERDTAAASMEERVRDRDQAIASMEQMIRDRDAELTLVKEMLQDKESCIFSTEERVRDRDAVIASMEKMIEDRDEAAEKMEEMIQERDTAIASMEKMIRERDITIAAEEERTRTCDTTITSMEKMIEDRDTAIASMEKMIEDRDAAIASMEKMIQDRDAAIASMEKMIQERDAAVSDMDEMIRERDERIEQLEKRRFFRR